MHPVHDIDAVILLAVALSSKRRPAELIELVAAAELITGKLPYPAKLAESVARLFTSGEARWSIARGRLWNHLAPVDERRVLESA